MGNVLVPWTLVARKKKCLGTSVEKVDQVTVDDCARACRKEASMFRFGLNKLGGALCNGLKCGCFCEHSGDFTEICTLIDDEDYAVYKYTTKGKKVYTY